LGEVYQLGKHRLMCGDSTKIEDLEKLMDGKNLCFLMEILIVLRIRCFSALFVNKKLI
jgi:hypothetical protein